MSDRLPPMARLRQETLIELSSFARAEVSSWPRLCEKSQGCYDSFFESAGGSDGCQALWKGLTGAKAHFSPPCLTTTCLRTIWFVRLTPFFQRRNTTKAKLAKIKAFNESAIFDEPSFGSRPESRTSRGYQEILHLMLGITRLCRRLFERVGWICLS
jgi:hypothetical protein